MADTLYIKADRASKVASKNVTVGDVATLYCKNTSITAKCKTLKILSFQQEGKERYVCSIMKVISLIQEEYPGLDIQNIGEMDFLVEKDTKNQPSPAWEWTKVALICLAVFFGAAFAIMTFNNDVSVKELFDQIYQQVTGKEAGNFNTLEVGYSVGLAIGILVFYNHFGKRKIHKDPTPIEVEMRLYEKDIENTLIDGVQRKGARIDVD